MALTTLVTGKLRFPRMRDKPKHRLTECPLLTQTPSNSVGPWAVIYSAWSTGTAAKAKAPVPVWQLAVLSATISLGLITYGYNIMKGESAGFGNPLISLIESLTNLELFLSARAYSYGQQDHLPLSQPRIVNGDGCRSDCPRLLAILASRLHVDVHHRCYRRCRSL
jgi:hypothetical protein